MKALVAFLTLGCVVALVAGCAASTPTSPAAPTQAPAGANPTQAPAAAPTSVPPTSAAPAGTAYPKPEATTAAPAAGYPAPAGGAWAADGAVGADEYAQKTAVGPVTVYWSNDAQSLYLAAQAKTTGWVAVGLDPVDRMQGANYILAAYDGQARIMDAFGTATVAAHPADETLGGKNDIIAYAVAEKDGVTTFEVQIPLDSGDANDKVLKPGETYRILAAFGAADDFKSPHSYRGAGEITLAPAP